ncbi:hypothetical protein EI543_13490 [Enterococcus faecium]|uniref:Uncharacterized protein n=1 Tax=Escherichia phage PGN829.1 TaxID=2315696 RepID=A0A385IIA3_9CAUD|nr:hypothetical protein PP765_gp43 [Escherichia phage PGN829.1]AXY82577.1 hypothetical protein [Escherichia phage PGN829.1]QHQ49120.1 hypothetical protein EI543_13490 [Enterococcus faecium]
MHPYCLISFATTCYLSPYTLDNILAGRERVTTILYEPSEEAEVFIGTCLMLGQPIKFIKIEDSVEVPEHTSVYILSVNEPMVVTTLTGRLITLYPSTSYLSSDESL